MGKLDIRCRLLFLFALIPTSFGGGGSGGGGGVVVNDAPNASVDAYNVNDVSAAGTEHPYVTATANGTSTFAKSNLHVWAYEEYDNVKRTPEERARLLRELGITKAGYVCRNAKRVAEFEAYVQAYKKEGIELIAAWTPVNTEKPLEEPQISGFLDVAERYKLKIQWWLTLEEDFDKVPEAGRVKRAVVQLRPLVVEANKRGCRLVVYGHGRNRWFTQCENQITILESLKKEMPAAHLGIVYNFHQSHAQMGRLKDIFPQLKPHLVAVNLNGMHSKGPQIAPLGKGDRESGMIDVIYKSGWRGPVGIIAHNRSADAKQTLQANLDGLRSILKKIGDEAGFATF